MAEKSDPVRGKPWLALYGAGLAPSIRPDFTNALDIFHAAVARAAERPALHYFDRSLSYGELDALSNAFAAALHASGFIPGDRLALILQNVPQFIIALLGTWKAGGIAVPINPMNQAREIGLLFADCTPKAAVVHETALPALEALSPQHRPPLLLCTSPLAFQSRNDPRLFKDLSSSSPANVADFGSFLESGRGRPFRPASFGPEDTAFLVYTSGTTGPPKGAMNTHGNVAFNAQTYRDWIGLEEGAPILALAPLFHITGLIGHIAAAFLTAAPLILTYRFEAGVMLEAIAAHEPHFTIGAITAFIALMNHPDAHSRSFSSLHKLYSGGAPVPPAVVEAFRDKFGIYIHNGYGMTETTSPSHVVPFGREAPVDPASGSLAIGVPVFNTDSWIAGEDGRPLPSGEIGEIVVRGPQVVPGYWRRPEETAAAIRDGWLYTGDVGFMDEAGWFYLVDRKKDMINAAGFKVWPREVEDVLYTHPAIREAAVVGVPDPYRGETVKAVVSLKPGMKVTEEELIAFCKARMAAYKYPRLVEIRDDLPKTSTGKILRRALRG
jgi:long-chain acyl-CoA synthetase